MEEIGKELPPPQQRQRRRNEDEEEDEDDDLIDLDDEYDDFGEDNEERGLGRGDD